MVFKLTPAEVDEIWVRWRSGQAVKVLVAADAGESVDGAGSVASHGWHQTGAEASVGAAAVAIGTGGDLARLGGGVVVAADSRWSGSCAPSSRQKESPPPAENANGSAEPIGCARFS